MKRAYWPTGGWRTAPPRERGMDAGRLQAAADYIRRRLPGAYSLLVVRHGDLVFEQYYRRHQPTDLTELKSVTKSITAALVGVALKQGYVKSLDQQLEQFFPAYMDAGTHPLTPQTTLRHLLTMSSGLFWATERPASHPLHDRMARSGNWVKFMLNLPVKDPARRFAYKEVDSHLLSAVITNTAAMPALAFADRYLFGPLGITDRLWMADPQGINTGGFGLSLCPRDLAKVGYLYLNQGEWDGEQILSPDWVRESTRAQASDDYGYQWWRTSVNGHDSYLAQGYGGQLLQVIPSLDLVAVITSDSEHQRGPAPHSVISDYVVPAVSR